MVVDSYSSWIRYGCEAIKFVLFVEVQGKDRVMTSLSMNIFV